LLGKDEMGLFLGEEKNIFQNDDLGEGMDEMDEVSFLKQIKTSILFQNLDIKKN
jgi:hypothetical protein